MTEDEAPPPTRGSTGRVTPAGDLSQTLKAIRDSLRLRPQRGWGVIFALVYWSMVGTAGVTATMPVITLFKGPSDSESTSASTTEAPEGEERPAAESAPPVAEKKEAVRIADLETPEHVAENIQPDAAASEPEGPVVNLAELESQARARLAEPLPSPESSPPVAEPSAMTAAPVMPESEPSAVMTPAPESILPESFAESSAAKPKRSAPLNPPSTPVVSTPPDRALVGTVPAGDEKAEAADATPRASATPTHADAMPKSDVDAELAAAGIEIVEVAALEAEESAARSLREKNARQILVTLPRLTELPAIHAGRHYVLIESSTDATRLRSTQDRLSALGVTLLQTRSTWLQESYTHLLTGPFATSGESIQAARLLTEQMHREVFPLIADRVHRPGETIDPIKAVLPPDEFPLFQDGRFMIVAGSFTDGAHLSQAQNILAGNGILYTTEEVTVKDRLYRRLLVGPYATREQANLALPILQLRAQLDAWVITLDAPRKAVRLWQSPEKRSARDQHLARVGKREHAAGAGRAAAGRDRTGSGRSSPSSTAVAAGSSVVSPIADARSSSEEWVATASHAADPELAAAVASNAGRMAVVPSSTTPGRATAASIVSSPPGRQSALSITDAGADSGPSKGQRNAIEYKGSAVPSPASTGGRSAMAAVASSLPARPGSLSTDRGAGSDVPERPRPERPRGAVGRGGLVSDAGSTTRRDADSAVVASMPTPLSGPNLPAFLRGVTVAPVLDDPSPPEAVVPSQPVARQAAVPASDRAERSGGGVVRGAGARAVATREPGKGNQYAVLVGVFDRTGDARHTLARLAAGGVEYFLKETEVGGRHFVQILVGPFDRRDAAKDAADRVRSQTGLVTYCIDI
ncbi:MAG: SPOR domain-containing protein [Magnetococcales bacterium]|nr:SPOR domain-containing protein [Magnetococcales bacterium]